MSEQTMVIPFVPGVREGDKDAASKVQKVLQQGIQEYRVKRMDL